MHGNVWIDVESFGEEMVKWIEEFYLGRREGGRGFACDMVAMSLKKRWADYLHFFVLRSEPYSQALR